MSEKLGYHAVELELPFGITLPDGEYKVQFREKQYRCIFRAIPNLHFPWQSSDNGEISLVYDRRGGMFHTQVWIVLSQEFFSDEDFIRNRNDGTQPELLEPTLRDKRVEEAIAVLNHIINVYRYCTQEFHLPNVAYLDVSYKFGFADDETGRIHYAKDVREPDTSQIPRLSFSQRILAMSRKIQGTLEVPFTVPIIDDLLLRAKEFFLWEDYKFSLLCGVMALESALTQLIQISLEKVGIHEIAIGYMVGESGIGIPFKDRLDVISHFLSAHGKKPLDAEALEQCKKAISYRNNIVHGKELKDNLTLKNTDKMLVGIQKIVTDLRELFREAKESEELRGESC